MADDYSNLDIFNSVSNDVSGFILALQGRPNPQILTAPPPAVSLGLSGQSGTLVILAIVVIGAIWIATKK